MGGYGALGWALSEPERFAAAASLSGALDVFSLADGVEPATAPALYICCGTGDPLLDGSTRLAAAAAGRGLAVTSSFTEGVHEWGYWDARIRDVLAWLPL